MADCGHKRGDWLSEMGFWLCADCFARLDGRPSKYGMVASPFGSEGCSIPRHRQEMVWQAAIAEADGVTLNEFLRTMSRRFIRKTRPPMSREDAYELSISTLKEIGDPYGDPAYDWSREAARDIADEEMTYWEPSEGANA